MPNIKRDTTHRTRNKSYGYWIFGVIGIAIVLLILGRLASDGLSNNNPSITEVRNIQINQDDESSPVELYTDEVESATGSSTPAIN